MRGGRRERWGGAAGRNGGIKGEVIYASNAAVR